MRLVADGIKRRSKVSQAKRRAEVSGFFRQYWERQLN
jgi:hypothetical protein